MKNLPNKQMGGKKIEKAINGNKKYIAQDPVIGKFSESVLCLVCKFKKIIKTGDICEDCQELLNDIKKSIKRTGYTTWPKLHEELRISYSSVMTKLEYLVKKKILLPPDESGKYYLVEKLVATAKKE